MFDGELRANHAHGVLRCGILALLVAPQRNVRAGRVAIGAQVIGRCALGVITDKGRNVIPPTLSSLTTDESDFLARHVSELRASHSSAKAVRARFRQPSLLQGALQTLLDPESEEEFVATAVELVESLAASMRAATRAESCVAAIVTALESDGARTASFLKLDAEIEAAHLDQTEGGIRLRVFRDLLPAPGEMQKGISWPDPRSDSEVVVLDKNQGAVAQYFQNAFQVEASPRSLEVEKHLATCIAENLRPEEMRQAVEAIGDSSGPVERVVQKLQEVFPALPDSARGPTDQMPGSVRRGFLNGRKRTFESDGMKLEVPLGELPRVTVSIEGDHWITTIRTTKPFGPYSDNVTSTD